MLRILVILGLAAAVYGQSTTVSQCNSRAPLPLHVHVEGCVAPPCQLPQLSDAVIHVTFKNTKPVHSPTARAVAYLLFLPIPYDLGEQTDACRGVADSDCPLQEGDTITYTLRMFIEAFMPVGVSVNLEFSLLDDARDPLFCIRFGLSVVAPLQHRIDSTADNSALATA